MSDLAKLKSAQRGLDVLSTSQTARLTDAAPRLRSRKGPYLVDQTKAWSRRFKEPGVIIAFACATPKVYLRYQGEAMIDSLTRSLDWLPAVLGEQAFTSLKMFTSNGTNTGVGPLGFRPSADYWLDIRDLFVHGDQFVNFALTATDANIVALPGTDGKSRFISSTDANDLFSDSLVNKVHMEGRARLSLLSQVTDMTPNIT